MFVLIPILLLLITVLGQSQKLASLFQSTTQGTSLELSREAEGKGAWGKPTCLPGWLSSSRGLVCLPIPLPVSSADTAGPAFKNVTQQDKALTHSTQV